MGRVFYFSWEIELMKWLQSFESPITTALAKFFTLLGEEYLMILILGLCFWCIDKKLGRRIALAVTGSMIFGSLIKGLVLRRRPYFDNKDVKCIRAAHPEDDLLSESAQGYSFPSLHASMSASVYGTLAYYVKKALFIIIGILLPLFIGLSRPYLGVHYPTDVIIGWILGTICIFLFSYIDEKYGYKVGYIILLIIGAFGFIYCRDVEFFSAYGITIGLLLGFSFEEKYVNFNMSKKWWSFVLRPILGVIVFIVINALLKLPASYLFVDETSLLPLIYRCFRYAVGAFVTLGVYPCLFKFI